MTVPALVIHPKCSLRVPDARMRGKLEDLALSQQPDDLNMRGIQIETEKLRYIYSIQMDRQCLPNLKLRVESCRGVGGRR